MSKNQINKYVWLVETLYKAKKITLKEINRRWLETDLSDALEILEPLWLRKEMAGIVKRMWNNYK